MNYWREFLIAVLIVLSMYLAFHLVECRQALHLSQVEEAKIWKVYNVCLDSDVQNQTEIQKLRGAK